jgi:serine/threonine protein kinase
MITFAKKHLLVENKKNIKSKVIGGVLNDVYLIKVPSSPKEKKIIAKRFRDWSGFKWFPLSLWSLGVRNLSVLGRSRLARECEINGLLINKGFRVPKILHVSHKNRLVFMEYIDGEDLSVFIKRFLKLNNSKKTTMKTSLMQEVGELFARVHSLNVTLGDTKPENILVDSNGELFLLDSGSNEVGRGILAPLCPKDKAGHGRHSSYARRRDEVSTDHGKDPPGWARRFYLNVQAAHKRTQYPERDGGRKKIAG